jgi:hypothetical protein
MILTDLGVAYTRLELPALTQYRPCNPSVVSTGGFYFATVRGCNYDLKRGYHFTIGSSPSRTPDSQNYFVKVNKRFEIESYWFLEDRHLRSDVRCLDGIEDLRLFEYRGGLYVLGSALNYLPKPKNTMVLCRLDDGVLRDPVFIKSPLGIPVEKNWMPLVRGNDLYFVYYVNPFQMYRFDGAGLVKVPFRVNEQDWPPNLSGSSCVMPYGDGYLAVVHRKTQDHRTREYFYRHHLVEFDADMRPVRLGRRFSFENDHIEFCAGLAFDGDDVVFSYGLLDQKAVMLRLSKDDLRRLF